ncbi:hypothetical protein QZH41_012546, partial [Actinostola sp. cb2023]
RRAASHQAVTRHNVITSLSGCDAAWPDLIHKNTLKNERQRTREKVIFGLCFVECESDCSERSGAVYSPYDLSILQRLQYLTQRVEYLEHKLDNSLSNHRAEDLCFGLNVKNECNIPNVDIQVLAGRRDEALDGEEDIMQGWDDAIVEHNTSFIIIPVGDDKDLQTHDSQLLKQTLGVSAIARRPALCPDTFTDANGCKEGSSAAEKPSKTSAISDECCQCQTGIATEDDFREELKSISRDVIETGSKSGVKKKRLSLKKYFLDEEQGEMDIFGAKLQQ